MVHQHFMLIPVMTVAENIVLGAEPRKGALLDRAAAERARARAVASASAWRSIPTRDVEDIAVGQQQRVEILRALYRGADILVLDEPTAVLTAQETAGAVRRPARADRRGRVRSSSSRTSCARCSTIADRVTVLRRGKKVATVDDRGRRPRPSLAR